MVISHLKYMWNERCIIVYLLQCYLVQFDQSGVVELESTIPVYFVFGGLQMCPM